MGIVFRWATMIRVNVLKSTSYIRRYIRSIIIVPKKHARRTDIVFTKHARNYNVAIHII